MIIEKVFSFLLFYKGTRYAEWGCMRFVWIILLIFYITQTCCAWTHTYVLEPAYGPDQRYVEVYRQSVPLFTRMICSCNALTLEYGTFRMWGRVRYADSQRWSSWHCMMEWCSETCRTFYTKQDPDILYRHVKYETQRPADAFHVRIESYGEAPLALIKYICLNVSDWQAMHRESAQAYETHPSVKMLHVPRVSQFSIDHKNVLYLCAPAALSMMLSYVTRHYIDPRVQAMQGYDTGLAVYGSWPCNVLAASCYVWPRWVVYAARLPHFQRVLSYVAAGIPVIISVRGRLSGAPMRYPNGHMIVIIGYDKKRQHVLCADPAMPHERHVYTRYLLSDILSAWQRSYRLAYVCDPVK